MTCAFEKECGCGGGQRRRRRWSFLPAAAVLLALTLGAAPARADAIPPSSRAANAYSGALDLAAQGQLQAALDLLRAWQPDSAAGQEQKLWGEAVILRQMGRNAEALPLLERLVARHPGVPRFRIALGETLARLGQSDRARLHLQEALGGTPSEADRARAAAGLGALEVDRPIGGHFALAFIPATNAAQRTSARTVTIGGRPFVLAPASRKTSALGLRVQAGVTYAPRLTETLRLRFGLSGDAKLYDSHAEDDVLLRAESAVALDLTPSTQLEAGVTYARRWIDGAGYSRGPGLTLGLVTYPDQRSRLQFAAVIDDLTHDSAPGLDGVRSLAVLAYAFAPSPRMQLRGSVRAERANALSASSSYTAVELGLGGTYVFDGGLRLGIDASWRMAEYDAISPFFGQRREDEQLTATVRMTHPRMQFMGFAPELEVEYTKRASSIPVYSFDDLGARIGFTRRF